MFTPRYSTNLHVSYSNETERWGVGVGLAHGRIEVTERFCPSRPRGFRNSTQPLSEATVTSPLSPDVRFGDKLRGLTQGPVSSLKRPWKFLWARMRYVV